MKHVARVAFAALALIYVRDFLPAGIRSANCDLNRSIHEGALIGNVQGKRGYFNIKTLSVRCPHLVGATHHSRWRVERRATRVSKALSRLENRLLSDNTWSLDLGQFTTRIRDHPVPAQQLHRFATLVHDDHSISPEILRTFRR